MNQDFSELIEYLDGKFSKIDERFVGIDTRLSNIEMKLESKADKADINELMNAIDAYAKKADAYFQEMVMLAHKVDRLEKWVNEIAKKLGMKLEY